MALKSKFDKITLRVLGIIKEVVSMNTEESQLFLKCLVVIKRSLCTIGFCTAFSLCMLFLNWGFPLSEHIDFVSKVLWSLLVTITPCYLSAYELQYQYTKVFKDGVTFYEHSK